MYDGLQVKICGLTRESDIDLALELGADFLGFIVYPKSPRGLQLDRAVELSNRVPVGRRVLVDVEAPAENLARYRDAGFDYFQIHNTSPDLTSLALASELVGADRLWAAPRHLPGQAFPSEILSLADTVLMDTYHRDQVGGTGETGDWAGFAQLKQGYPDTNWVLAGGLGPGNVAAAIAMSGTDAVDVNSGVESEPGIKNPEKLRELFRILKIS